jgi:hypothetical protein
MMTFTDGSCAKEDSVQEIREKPKKPVVVAKPAKAVADKIESGFNIVGNAGETQLILMTIQRCH